MGDPMVSVVMPVFNAERYLRDAVDSVLSQDFQDFEFIVLDDGSSDTSCDILKGYADPRLHRVHNTQNMGIPSVLNKGFSLARGRYIARMDADDVCRPSRFSQQVAFLESHQQRLSLLTYISL